MPDPSRRAPSLKHERGAGMGVMHHHGTGFQMPLRQPPPELRQESFKPGPVNDRIGQVRISVVYASM